MLDFPDDEGDSEAMTGEQLVVRTVFRNLDAAEYLGLGGAMTNSQAAQHIQKAVAGLEGWIGGRERFRVQGVQDRWKYREDATAEERLCGYRLYEEED